mgnify:CR=1 FL=1
MADAADLNSAAARREGSNPSPGTTAFEPTVDRNGGLQLLMQRAFADILPTYATIGDGTPGTERDQNTRSAVG